MRACAVTVSSLYGGELLVLSSHSLYFEVNVT